MADLDTTIAGSPESIRVVSRWLRDDFGDAAEDLATSTWRQRSRAASDWEGQAGQAFQQRAGRLAGAGDESSATALLVADVSDDLAVALTAALGDMASLRVTATAAGLTVVGNLVHNPGPAPVPAGVLPADATPAEAQAWERANRAVRDHNLLVEAWNAANAEATRVFHAWGTALESAATDWRRWDKELAGLTADFLTAAAEIAIIARTVPVLVGQSEWMKTRAIELRNHADSLKNADDIIPDGARNHFYRLLDEATDLETRAPRVYYDARTFQVPKGVGRALGVLGIAATGFSIHEDMKEGESASQAAVSNVAAMGASIAAGAYVGGAIGTAIPVPLVGTVTGVVVGAAVGTAVGAFTSGAIDSLWDSGLDSLGDAGEAVEDGWNEITDTGEAVGDLASDAWNALF